MMFGKIFGRSLIFHRNSRVSEIMSSEDLLLNIQASSKPVYFVLTIKVRLNVLTMKFYKFSSNETISLIREHDGY